MLKDLINSLAMNEVSIDGLSGEEEELAIKSLEHDRN